MVNEKLLAIKPMYRVTELASALNVSPKTAAAMFRREGVPLFPRVPTRGSPLRVPYNALNTAMPGLFDSIARIQCGRRGGRDWF